MRAFAHAHPGATARAGIVAVTLAALFAVALTQPVWAQSPVVDGYLRDPVTGVVEGAYVINGITYTQDQITGDFAGYLYTAEDAGNLYFGFEQSVFINDNTYEANAIGWPGKRGHRLKDLLNSEHIKVKLYDCDGNLAMEFYLDYATQDRDTGVVDCLGVTGGDGAMLLGDPAHVTAASSALDWDFNDASPTWPDKFTTNPMRVPTNTYDPGTTADPNAPWIYELTYEWSIDKAAFANGCFGSIEILEVHNSPYKTGNPVPLPMLNVQKTADPPSGSEVDPGQTITFTITATNVGQTTFNDVVITDVPDHNLSNIMPLDGGTYDGSVVTWGPFTLAPNDTVSVSFQADVDPVEPAVGECPNGLKIFNTGTITTPDLPTPVNTNTTEHCVNPRPILTILKVANPTSTVPGATVSYSITVENVGSATANNVTVTDDPDETYVEAITNISHSGTYNGDITTWNLGAMGPGDVITVTYDAELYDASAGIFPAGTTNVVNTAVADSDDTEPVSDVATVEVTAYANLTIVKSGSPLTASPGDTIHYTITVTSDGTAPATNVTLTDDPDETYVASISGITGGGSYDGNFINWSFGTMNPGDSVTVEYDANLKGPGAFPAGTTAVDNTAVVTSDETGDSTDDETVDVTAVVILALDKSSSVSQVTRTVENTGSIQSDQTAEQSSNTTSDSVVAASQLTYTLTYTNSGDANASGVVIMDVLPANTKFVSASDGGTYDAGTNTVTWNIGVVGWGATGSVTLVVETTN